jgi:predicted nuclease of restriction endonuclease-like (RecB) superfamily
MVHQIEAKLYDKQGFLINNFKNTTNHSELVTQIFKDPYKFDFIYLGTEAREKDLENALASQMSKVLREFGPYFGFLGRQFRVTLGEKEFFYDLLFYHTRLKRYIVIELKIGDFKAEYIGKMNLYLAIADEQLRDQQDEKSIGLILCKTKDGLVAEYALRDSNKAIGIAEYKLKERLPEFIRGELPSIEEIEQNMEQELKMLKSPFKARMDGLIQRLSSIQMEEVKSVATHQNLVLMFEHSLKPYLIIF